VVAVYSYKFICREVIDLWLTYIVVKSVAMWLNPVQHGLCEQLIQQIGISVSLISVITKGLSIYHIGPFPNPSALWSDVVW